MNEDNDVLDLSTLSDDDLRDLYSTKTPPATEADSSWKRRREHALAEFWRRRLSTKEVLSDVEVNELLAFADLEVALAALGDAARLDLLSPIQCAALMDNTEIDVHLKSVWLKSELGLRLLVNQLRQTEQTDERRAALDKLLHQKRLWPIQQLVDELTHGELEFCMNALDDRTVLTKGNRELARRAIRRSLKSL